MAACQQIKYHLSACGAEAQHRLLGIHANRFLGVSSRSIGRLERRPLAPHAKAKSGKQSSKGARKTKAAKPRSVPASAAVEPEIIDVEGQYIDMRIPVTVRPLNRLSAGLGSIAVPFLPCSAKCHAVIQLYAGYYWFSWIWQNHPAEQYLDQKSWQTHCSHRERGQFATLTLWCYKSNCHMGFVPQSCPQSQICSPPTACKVCVLQLQYPDARCACQPHLLAISAIMQAHTHKLHASKLHGFLDSIHR